MAFVSGGQRQLTSAADILRRFDGFGKTNLSINNEFFGLSATQAFQVSNVATPQHILERIIRSDAFANSGGMQASAIGLGIFRGATGGVFGRKAGMLFQRNFASGVIMNMFMASNATMFGADDIALEQMALLRERFEGETSRRSVSSLLSAARNIARGSNSRVMKVLANIGLDVNLNLVAQRIGTLYTKGGSRGIFIQPKSVQQQLLDDLKASGGINIPSGKDLLGIAEAFGINRFTNFNNTDLTGNAINKLNITEQTVFDIRFNITRGDRELLNRLRFVEQLEAASSGTAPI